MCFVSANIYCIADFIAASWSVIMVAGCFPPIASMNASNTHLKSLNSFITDECTAKQTGMSMTYDSYKWGEWKVAFVYHVGCVEADTISVLCIVL